MLLRRGKLGIFFSEEQVGTPAFFYAWATRDGVTLKAWVKPNIWTKHLRQGPDARAEFLITGVRADVCSASSPCYPSLSILPLTNSFLPLPLPDFLCPSLHNLEREHPANWKFAQLLLKHINQNAYFIIQL